MITLTANAKTDVRLLNAYNLYLKAISCKPVITSGYRTPRRNRQVGGVKNSYHLKGQAFDLVFPGCLTPKQDLFNIAKLFFNGVIEYHDHLHVDIRETPYYGKGK